MQAINIQRYTFSKNDRLFFDTNIWLSIYGPYSPNRRSRVYSNAFKEIITCGSKIYVDILVLSEFTNRLSRFYYDLWCQENNLTPDYKIFRSMPDYQSVASDIEGTLQVILVDATPIETGFPKMDHKTLFENFKNYQSDFNDLVICQLCQENDLKLITDDGDFKNSGLHLITFNRNLLN